MRKFANVIVTLGLSAVAVGVVTAAATGYHVVSEVKIGGDGGWDYLTVDSAARRI